METHDNHIEHTQPPVAVESEQAVLGALLMTPSKYAILDTVLSKEDFHVVEHGHIWDAFGRLYYKGNTADIVLLSQELHEMGKLEFIGGENYLSSLVELTPGSDNIESYANTVARTSARRKMLTVSELIRKQALNEKILIEDAISEAEGAIASVRVNVYERDFKILKDALSEYYDKVETLIESDEPVYNTPTGFDSVDELIGGMQKGDLIVFAGRTGMGKTAWLLSAALNIASDNNVVAAFTMEMPVEQITQRIVAMETGIPIQSLRIGDVEPQKLGDLIKAIAKLHEYPIFLDDTPSITPQELKSRCQRLKIENGLDVIIVDYIQFMSGGKYFSNNRVQEISYISKSLKEIARELDVTVIAAAQLNRGVEYREDKRPVLSDLRESGSIEQDADAVLFLYRDSYYNPETTDKPGLVEINIAKNRHGPTGTTYLKFESSTTKFHNAPTMSTEEYESWAPSQYE